MWRRWTICDACGSDAFRLVEYAPADSPKVVNGDGTVTREFGPMQYICIACEVIENPSDGNGNGHKCRTANCRNALMTHTRP